MAKYGRFNIGKHTQIELVVDVDRTRIKDRPAKNLNKYLHRSIPNATSWLAHVGHKRPIAGKPHRNKRCPEEKWIGAELCPSGLLAEIREHPG